MVNHARPDDHAPAQDSPDGHAPTRTEADERTQAEAREWSERTSAMVVGVALAVAAVTAVPVSLSGEGRTLLGMVTIATPALVAALVTAIAHLGLLRRHDRDDHLWHLKLATVRRVSQTEREERTALRELDAALDIAADERAAIEMIRESLLRHLPARRVELHLVDPVEPVLDLAVATGEPAARPGTRTSPWASTAARTNRTLVYPTTSRADVCTHLASRLDAPTSAIAVPVNATGRLLGVLYQFGPEGTVPAAHTVQLLEDLARVIGARLALARTAAVSRSSSDTVDRLTGLPDRRAMQQRVLRMLQERQPFAVAVADIDGFARLNETHGRPAGDRALETLGRVARTVVRPGDVIGRIGGDEFLFVFPRTSPDDATRAFERLREALVLASASPSGDDECSRGAPGFTLSAGVIGSDAGGTIEEILRRAAAALDHARTQGGNRVVVADPAPDPSSR